MLFILIYRGKLPFDRIEMMVVRAPNEKVAREKFGTPKRGDLTIQAISTEGPTESILHTWVGGSNASPDMPALTVGDPVMVKRSIPGYDEPCWIPCRVEELIDQEGTKGFRATESGSDGKSHVTICLSDEGITWKHMGAE